MISVAYTIGRICLAIPFLISGVQKLMAVAAIGKLLSDIAIPIPDEIAPYLAGIPKYEALGYLLGGIEVLAAVMVLIGWKARWGALVLAIFAACTIAFVHHFWDMDGAAAALNQALALKNLAVLGGLLLVVGVGSGAHAVDRRA